MSGRPFSSLESRVFASYLDTLADFSPLEGAVATRAEQAKFYAFVKSAYARAAEEPKILISTSHPDDAHPNRFGKSSYGKPELATDIRKTAGAMDAFFGFLAEAGEAGQADADGLTLPEGFSVPKKHQKAMAAFGLTLEGNRIASQKWQGIYRAWKMLCAPLPGEIGDRRRIAKLEKCAFVENPPGMKGAFGRLLGGEAESFAAWLEAHGYQRETLILNKEISTLRYTKDGFGAQFCYDYQARTPAYLQLLLRGWREILPQFAGMRASLQSFILKHNKQCDDCGYCTQRSKGRAQKFAVTVPHEERELSLCPLFPGYSYVFEQLDAATVGGMMECLRFLEVALPPEKAVPREDDIRQFHI